MRTRILIVEDDEDIGTLLLSALRDERRDVFLARDLPAAIEIASATDIDVIVLDIALPRGHEGLTFMDWYYSESHQRAKTVVLTALGGDMIDKVREDPRVAAVMKKPFAIDDLNAIVEGLSEPAD